MYLYMCTYCTCQCHVCCTYTRAHECGTCTCTVHVLQAPSRSSQDSVLRIIITSLALFWPTQVVHVERAIALYMLSIHRVLFLTLIANAASPLITLPLLKYNVPKPFRFGNVEVLLAPTNTATVAEFNDALATK